MKIRFCKHCGVIIPDSRRPDALYCSQACAGKHSFKSIAYYADGNKIPCGTTGAMHELIVCSELMQLGFHVFRAESPNSPCDVIAMKNDGIYRIEVTTGTRGITKNYYPKKCSTYKFDYLAVVYHDHKIEWKNRVYEDTEFPHIV